MNDLFHDLFIFEMANNHQGLVEHGRSIIKTMGKVARQKNIRAGVKLQYRDLDTFIHPDYIKRNDIKHVPRFMSTRLTPDQFRGLIETVREENLTSVVTPFDEVSVGRCMDHGVEILKVASCSAKDWPLLEAMAETKKPIIASTGGLSIYDIDNIVSFFTHAGINFAIMHCVAMYPTPPENAGLNFIERLRTRYPNVPIGYSGHEPPDETEIAQVAVSKGAQLLERHVGVPTDTITLNAYSMNPEQVGEWIDAVLRAKKICGVDREKRISQDEIDSIKSLMRGVVAKESIKKGDVISRDSVLFSMPCVEGQITSGEFGQHRAVYTATKDYAPNDPIKEYLEPDMMSMIRGVIHDAKGMLYEAGVHLGSNYTVELSHHYGMDHFRTTGAVIVNLINREYCKKLIIMLPGQKHPNHKHLKKEETFQVLWGDMKVVRNNDEIFELTAGEQLLIERNNWHRFSTKSGLVFEEISSTHYRDDSFYEDPELVKLDPLERKSLLESW